MSTFTGTPFFRLVARLNQNCIAPLQTVARKRSRLHLLGVGDVEALPRAVIDIEAGRRGCDALCADIVVGHSSFLAQHVFHGIALNRRRWRSIPLLLDLDEYPDFAAYVDRLKRSSDGNITRELNRARARGYFCQRFDRAAWSDDLYRIDVSKVFRSSGLVLPAVTPRPQARHQASPPVACPRHWYMDWGVFLPEDGPRNDAGERCVRLVGYMYVKRIGTTARVTGFMGHGAHLRHGIMKLLFCEVVSRLLDRADPTVTGIRFLQYGDAEHGGVGLLLWRRRLQLRPFVLRHETVPPTIDQARPAA